MLDIEKIIVYPFHIKINNKNVTKIKNELKNNPDIIVFFDSSKLICKKQLQAALIRAYRARKNNKMVSNLFSVEIWLQMVATNQISKATKILDVSNSTEIITFVQTKGNQIIENSLPGIPDINITINVLAQYKLNKSSNPCDDIISRGARFVLDYE